jgi:hypothetical protein
MPPSNTSIAGALRKWRKKGSMLSTMTLGLSAYFLSTVKANSDDSP